MDRLRAARKGLSSQEAQQFLKEYGLNQITERKTFTLLHSLVSQLNNFLVYLLIAAATVSFTVGERVDSFFILGIVILNAFFGVYQEYKSERALSLLKKLTLTKTRVIRGGKEEEIESKYLVPEDIIYLEEGAKIPADGVVLSSHHLEVNEASLTGESLPVEKNSQDKNEIYSGTIVTKGKCYAKISKTGDSTKFGEIAQTLVEIEKEKTPLQKKLEKFSKQVGAIGILAAIFVFGFSFIEDKNLLESFLFATSLAVAAVPEGLPAVMTITLAIGVERMAKKKAILRKLSAIEALGSITLIATDKTGTLTTNQMRVKKLWIDKKEYDTDKLNLAKNETFKKLLLDGILCSTASLVLRADGKHDVVGDPTEGALLYLAQKEGLDPNTIKNEWETKEELAFNPETKRMTVAVEKDNKFYVFAKGAPESILEISSKLLVDENEEPLTNEQKAQIENKFQEFAAKGLRIIAFSYKTDSHSLERDHTFLGFAGLADPVREEVKEAVFQAKSAGVKIVMITGDNELTAEAIGLESQLINKGGEILTGEQLDKLDDLQLISLLKKVKIFARTTPTHKLRLVKLYKSQGEIVAVTGDGVNDALALKQADVGVAMGITGTDVAKEIADMVITDDNFATIVNAINQGRNIFSHIKNAIKYLLSCNLGEVVYILLAVVFRFPVFTPLQILYINLITDGIPALSLAFAPSDERVMKEKPNTLKFILNKGDFKYLFFVGILSALLILASNLPFINADKPLSRSIVFTTLVFIQPFVLLDLWLSHRSVFKHFSLLRKGVFITAFLSTFIIHPFVLYNPFLREVFGTAPLQSRHFIFIFFLSLCMLLALEIFKRLKFIQANKS